MNEANLNTTWDNTLNLGKLSAFVDVKSWITKKIQGGELDVMQTVLLKELDKEINKNIEKLKGNASNTEEKPHS